MSSLLEAVRAGSERLVRVHVAVPRALRRGELERAVLLAAELGHVGVLQALMGAGVEMAETCREGHNTPLHVAVAHNHADAARLLAEMGPRSMVNLRSASGSNTPCHLAARLGYEQCLHVLLEYGARVDLRDSAGCTPLILAVRHKRYGPIKLLLERGCAVDVADDLGRTALHYASQMAMGVGLLLEAGAEVNVQDRDGCTPLLMAAAEGLCGAVRQLAGTGRCDVNLAQTDTGRTPLQLLAHKGHACCLPALIHAGAHLQAEDRQGRTALWYAVNNDRPAVVRLLLQASHQAHSSHCPPARPPALCPVGLAVAKGLVGVLKLFILAGHDRHHLQQALDTPHAHHLFDKQHLRHWFCHARDVMSLRATCRKWIRHHLGDHLHRDLPQLPVPPTVRDFLFLKELDDDHD